MKTSSWFLNKIFQLAKYVSTDEDLDAVEMHEPYTYLNGLTVDDLEDLLVDINIYRFNIESVL